MDDDRHSAPATTSTQAAIIDNNNEASSLLTTLPKRTDSQLSLPSSEMMATVVVVENGGTITTTQEEEGALGGAGGGNNDDSVVAVVQPVTEEEGAEGNAAGGQSSNQEGGSSSADAALESTTMVARGSIATSVYNIAATALGAGMLGMPYAFANLGIILGILCILAYAGLSIYSLHLMVVLSEKGTEERIARSINQAKEDKTRIEPIVRIGTYEALAMHYGNIWLKRCVGFFMVFVSWGVTVLYVSVIQQLLKPMHEQLADNTTFPGGDWGLRLIVVMFWLVIMLPLSLLKTITMLQSASAVSLFTGFLLAVAATIHIATSGATTDTMWGPTEFLKAVQGLANMKSGFGAQTAVMAVYRELAARTPTNMLKATVISTGGCGLFYVYIGLIGALDFGQNIGDNLLAQYPDPFEKWYVIVAFLGMAVTISLSFPILVFPPRDTILQIFGYPTAVEAPTWLRLVVGTAMATSSLLLGIFLPSLNLAFGVLGGVFGNLLSYVFPAIFAYRSNWVRGTMEKRQKYVYSAVTEPFVEQQVSAAESPSSSSKLKAQEEETIHENEPTDQTEPASPPDATEKGRAEEETVIKNCNEEEGQGEPSEEKIRLMVDDNDVPSAAHTTEPFETNSQNTTAVEEDKQTEEKEESTAAESHEPFPGESTPGAANAEEEKSTDALVAVELEGEDQGVKKATDEEEEQEEDEGPQIFHLFMSGVLFTVGAITGPLCTIVSIYLEFWGSSSASGGGSAALNGTTTTAAPMLLF